MPEIGEQMRVVNLGGTPVRFMWNSRHYDIAANGGHRWIPFECIKVYCGDPRATKNMQTVHDSIGIVSFVSDRETEVRRLRLLYGAPFGEPLANGAGSIFLKDETKRAITPGQNPEFEGFNIPNVQVFDAEGERVYTVLDDPQGLDTVAVKVTQSQVNENDSLRAQVQQQNILLQAMAERLGIDPATGAALNSPDLLHEEKPSDADAAGVDTGPADMVYDQKKDTIVPKARKLPTDAPSKLDEVPEDSLS